MRLRIRMNGNNVPSKPRPEAGDRIHYRHAWPPAPPEVRTARWRTVTKRLEWPKSATRPIGAEVLSNATMANCKASAMSARAPNPPASVIAESVFATRPAMSPKPILRLRNAATAISLAALRAVGAPPPARSASIAKPSAGKRLRSARSKVKRPSAARSGARTPDGIGQDRRGNARSASACPETPFRRSAIRRRMR